MAHAEEIRFDGRTCYALEATAPGSFLGVHHDEDGALVAVDAIGRRRLELKLRAGPEEPPPAN